MNVFIRSLAIGLSIGFLIVLLQYPISELAFKFIKSSAESVNYVKTYFNIVVWGAPAVLGLYAFKGWFIGMQNARIPMIIAITNNLLNIILSVGFVFGLGMKVEGIALGTLLSQLFSFTLASFLWFKYYGRLRKYIRKDTIWDKLAIRKYFRVNILAYACHHLLHICIFRNGRHYLGCQCPADAILYAILLLYGWFRLCSRSSHRTIYWRK